MIEFFRYPHTPHLAWLGSGVPRDDKVLSPSQVMSLLADDVTVEEKVDGANVGFSVARDGRILAQNRGQYLRSPFVGQFSRLRGWLDLHGDRLRSTSPEASILFGEWCAARHSIQYNRLPDWWLLFDVYDRVERRFWSVERRNALALELGLSVVPEIFRGRANIESLEGLVSKQRSAFGPGMVEGIVIRKDEGGWASSRAKLVRRDFTQHIAEHWRDRPLEWNQVRV